jgi:hypothetical protein
MFKQMHECNCTVVIIKDINMQPASTVTTAGAVPKYRLEKIAVMRPGFGDEYKVIEIATDRVAYRRISALVNKGMFAKIQAAVVSPSADATAVAGGAAATADTVKKSTKIRSFTPKMKYNILTEMVHGNHTKSDGKTQIEFQDRNKHTNKGPFYGSICRVLNDGASYPAFSKAKAVEKTVRDWIDSAMEERVGWLTQTYGANFIDHANFMAYSDSGESDEEENKVLNDDRISDERYNRWNKIFIDILIHHDKISAVSTASAGKVSPVPVHTSSQEEDMLATNADALSNGGGDKGDGKSRKKRKHQLDRPREKKLNPVIQLQEQQSSISIMLDKLMVFSDSAQPSSSATADPAIHSIHQALLSFATPPGTVSVCQKLAENLAGYGFCTFQELLDCPKDRAREILTELKWSPLQIDKVLGPKGSASAAAGGGAAVDN